MWRERERERERDVFLLHNTEPGGPVTLMTENLTAIWINQNQNQRKS